MPDVQTSIDVLKLALYWGPAILILLGFYKLVLKLGGALKPFGEQFITAQQNQAAALTAQAEATKELTRNFQDYMNRDNTEHKEMLVLLRVIAKDIRGFEHVKNEHDVLYGSPESKCAGGHS